MPRPWSAVPRRWLLPVAAFASAGPVRPNIPLLSAPMLLWVFWRQPWREWLLALLLDAATVLARSMPLILLSRGWSLYRRA